MAARYVTGVRAASALRRAKRRTGGVRHRGGDCGEVTLSTELHEMSDDDFARLIAGAPALASGIRIPVAGVETGATLGYLRVLAARLERCWFRAAWAIVSGGEIVGLIGCKGAPDADAAVEIGYGVAVGMRRRGHAAAAVARVVELVSARDDVRVLHAETAAENVASQRVLAGNGFERAGTRVDPDEGELILWHRAMPR